MQKKIVYLLGAGRSGTTIMATVLGAHNQILTIGEMHQFLDYLAEDKDCSCGEGINNCMFWKEILKKIEINSSELKNWQKHSDTKERHRNILPLLCTQKADDLYLHIHETIYEKIYNSSTNVEYLLDSSKYIARYLLLKRSENIDLRGIYVVRDVRGVINSFNKKVQTSRSAISTIIYYSLINFFGQVICWSDKNVIKIKYEDFVENTDVALAQIYNHLEIKDDKNDNFKEEYRMPHIIGGNRMKLNKTIVLKKDESWKEVIPRISQIVYYLLTLPFMLLNKYRM